MATLPSNLAASALADWLYSGLFVRYPELKLCLSEGGIGWIPAIFERADYVFERYAPRLKTGTGFGLTGMGSVDAGEFNHGSVDVRPSELFRDHVFGCFIDDRHGAASIERDRGRQRDGRVRLPARRQQLAAHPRAASSARSPTSTPTTQAKVLDGQRPPGVRAGGGRWVSSSASA